MEQEFDLEYVVVEFIKDKSLAVIPKNWLQENDASFPPYTNARKVETGLPHPGKVLESPGFFLLSWKVLESP